MKLRKEYVLGWNLAHQPHTILGEIEEVSALVHAARQDGEDNRLAVALAHLEGGLMIR